MAKLTRRPLKCDGPPPTWVSAALDSAKHVKVLTLAIPVEHPSPASAASQPPSPPMANVRRGEEGPLLSSTSSSSLRLLLGRKKRGFGEGYFNGFGGKLEPGESTADAALRELREESGLSASQMAHAGVLTFVFDDQVDRPWQVHVFAVRQWKGTPTETDEMAPLWLRAADLPFGRMWSDDRYWYPRFCEAEAAKEEEQQQAEGGGPGGMTQTARDSGAAEASSATASVSSAPCFEGVFGFRSTHEMAWAGLWALEREGERSVVADEAETAGVGGKGNGDSGSGARDAKIAPQADAAAAATWLPAAPAGGAALEPESMAHLARAADLARLTAATAVTKWGGWAGGGAGEAVAGAAAAADGDAS
jgi:8-oxo-dGTP pyrophosphatase MutT (NUDIX family)